MLRHAPCRDGQDPRSASQNGVKLAGFRSRKESTTPLPRLAADDAWLVSTASDTRSSSMQFWRRVFERRAPQSIASVQAHGSCR
jgi:hypothetical protein